MKTVFASIALFVAGAFAQNSFTINTPSNVVECQPTLLSWTGGTVKFFIPSLIQMWNSILPGSTPSGTAIESFPATNSNSYTWICNIASNTYIGFTVRDSTGAVAQSAPITINAGCMVFPSLTGFVFVPGPTGATSAAATASGATTAGASASAGTTAGSSASASTPSSTTKSGASANVAQFGAAGVVGAAVAALFL
ncbi:hypothetical protein J3R83DRAFT_12384 [Lanmaoa asiatica]|nr:hypothetical protein J3R83DRAFT_12384 [Lanmaoa asiatica]